MSLRVFLFAFFFSGVALADDVKEKCAQAYENTQNLRRDGKLGEARKQVLACLDSQCPKTLREECAIWFDEIEKTRPSIVLSVTDEAGRSLADAHVTIDGVPQPLDGRPIALDPGQHVIEFREGVRTPKIVRALVSEGEKDHRVAAVLESPAGPAPKPKRASYTLPIALGAVGVLALGSFTYFGLTGKSDESDLDSGCSPRCAPDRADGIERRYLVADISLLAALLSGVGATYFFLRPRMEP